MSSKLLVLLVSQIQFSDQAKAVNHKSLLAIGMAYFRKLEKVWSSSSAVAEGH